MANTDRGLQVPEKFTIIVLGGYGNFGAIICRRLVEIPQVDVIVAGRDPAKADALAQQIGAKSAELDIEQPGLAERFRELGIRLVISTVGPFNTMDYQVAQAAVEAGAHYADLADRREFVCGISALDAVAKESGLLVTSGASSVPALSSAVVDFCLPHFARLDSIHHGISASEKIPGLATVEGVLSYCGKPMKQWRDSAWTTIYGWQSLFPFDFPKPLGRRWLANCDVPDLEIFPLRYAGVTSVRFSAGTATRWCQFGTWGMSWLVRFGLLNNLEAHAAPLRRAGMWLQAFGSGKSGMFVCLRGIGLDGKELTLNWTLVARQEHGVNVPCLAVVALARKLSVGAQFVSGARPCVGVLTLDDYLYEVRGLDIVVSQRFGTAD